MRATIYCLLLIGFALVSSAAAQTAVRREKLLNGLTILHVQQPANGKVYVHLRTQGGAAFDLAGKEGTMQLLADSLFPDEDTRTIFREEYDGALETNVTYDALTIDMAGRAGEFENFIELLRNSVVVAPLITPETFTRLQTARVTQAALPPQISTAHAETLLHRAVRQNLYGANFPLGRAVDGTPASLTRVTPSDLLFARERFLNPNNSVLVIVGDVPFQTVRRAALQLLGSWRKSDRVVPTTFTQPDDAPTRRLVINHTTPQPAVAVALRTFPMKGRELFAAQLLARALQDTWQATVAGREPASTLIANYQVTYVASELGGYFFFFAVPTSPADAAKAEQAAIDTLRVMSLQIKHIDFEKAKISLLNQYRTRAANPSNFARQLAEAEVYGAAFSDPERTIAALTVSDVNIIARDYFRDARTVRVMLGDAAQLQTALAATPDKTPAQVVALSPSFDFQPTSLNAPPPPKKNSTVFTPVPRRN